MCSIFICAVSHSGTGEGPTTDSPARESGEQLILKHEALAQAWRKFRSHEGQQRALIRSNPFAVGPWDRELDLDTLIKERGVDVENLNKAVKSGQLDTIAAEKRKGLDESRTLREIGSALLSGNHKLVLHHMARTVAFRAFMNGLLDGSGTTFARTAADEKYNRIISTDDWNALSHSLQASLRRIDPNTIPNAPTPKNTSRSPVIEKDDTSTGNDQSRRKINNETGQLPEQVSESLESIKLKDGTEIFGRIIGSSATHIMVKDSEGEMRKIAKEYLAEESP